MIAPIQLDLFEEWKPIADHEDYKISTYGRCYASDRMIATKGGWSQFRGGRMLTPHSNRRGYYNYRIEGDSQYIHRLVAQAFIPNPDNKSDVDHIDGNRANNHVENLRWATRSENMRNPNTHPKMSEAQIKSNFVMLDADGNFICETKGFPAMCKICGFPKHAIFDCICRKAKATSRGFQFLHKEDYDPSKDYSYITKKDIGIDFVINERMFIVFSCGKLYDVFPSAAKAAKHYGIYQHILCKLSNTHSCSSTKTLKKLPKDCEIYLFKDLDDNKKSEVRKFYRNKYPIPDILKK